MHGCRYVAVHDCYPKDAAPPSGFRLILHSDRSKAAVWKLDPLLRDGEAHELALLRNPDSTFRYKDVVSRRWVVSLGDIRGEGTVGFRLKLSPELPNMDDRGMVKVELGPSQLIKLGPNGANSCFTTCDVSDCSRIRSNSWKPGPAFLLWAAAGSAP